MEELLNTLWIVGIVLFFISLFLGAFQKGITNGTSSIKITRLIILIIAYMLFIVRILFWLLAFIGLWTMPVILTLLLIFLWKKHSKTIQQYKLPFYKTRSFQLLTGLVLLASLFAAFYNV
jgi:hypothetical protein